MCRMDPKVAIITLNWNGWKDTIECLESLYQITYPSYDVIVVDNNSENDSIEKIKEYAEGKIKVESKFFEYDPGNKPIEIIEYTREEAEDGGGDEKEIANLPSNRKIIIIKNEKNYGFADGNNIGMRYALKNLNPDYVLLLNNDTVVDKAFLGELVKVAESDEKIGIVGPKVYYYDCAGRTDVIYFAGAELVLWKGGDKRYGFNEIDQGKWDEIREVNVIEGTCTLIKNELFKEVGLLDEKFFGYREDTDFCMRATKEGFKLLYAPNARIWHKVAASFGLGRNNPFKVYLMVRNRFLFIKKNASKKDIYKFLLYFLFYEFWFSSGVWLIYHKNFKVFLAFLRGAKDGFKFMINKT